jgi:hypothetical protein
MNTIESFKNLSRSFGNLNLAFNNNVNNYFNEGNFSQPKQDQIFTTKTVSIKAKPRFGSIPANTHNKSLPMKKDFLNRMRRRSIKNNKIVFCHSLKGKKPALEQVTYYNLGS